MKTVNRLYEGMFLVDTALATSDWDGVLSMIESMLKKFGGEIVSMRKWDERRLAYNIEKKTRGTYILVYFKLNTDKVSLLERDIVLSEKIMRAMILRTDAMSQEDMDRETPAAALDREGRARERTQEEAVEAQATEAVEAAPETAVEEIAEEGLVQEPEAEKSKEE